MISDYRCFYCFARAFERLIEKKNISKEEKTRFTRELVNDYHRHGDNFSAPLFSRQLHRRLEQITGEGDPYREIKKQSNDMALSMYPDLKKRVLSSDYPFGTALRLSIAGNIMDYAVGDYFDLWGTIDKVMHHDFAIDHSAELRQSVQQARKVLFIGDNAGEIVFDKLLIETMMHPYLSYAVRGAPVINDATREDACFVEMDRVADVIDNGFDAPSTILERCSPAFREAFDQADVIISKGQGNLEGLLNKAEKEVYFLLMVKCDVIADALKVRKGDFVVMKGNIG